jgi:hypothetical protein
MLYARNEFLIVPKRPCAELARSHPEPSPEQFGAEISVILVYAGSFGADPK